MDVEDENISTLMAMGFPDIGEIKRALRLAKNDLVVLKDLAKMHL
jgi:hypothetical protein